MLSKLRNLLGSKANDDESDFQRRVCAVLSTEFLGANAFASDDRSMIKVGETQISLENIRSKFNLSGRTDDDLREIVREHYLALLHTKKHLEAGSPDWETAAAILMPRIVSDGQFGKTPILTIPFCGNARIAFVLDSEKVLQYVSDELFESWERNIKEVLDGAIANLEYRSSDLAATAVPGNLFAIRTMDSFDAARILSPTIRQAIVETVGSPFCFGIPNRDFLVCWPKDAEMSEVLGNQVKIDFEEQPYPISRRVFECDEQGEINETH